VDIATDEAILYAKLLHRQGRELIQKHGDQLHEFMMEPLKSLYQADMMSTLLEFSNATQVNGKTPSRKNFYGRSTNPSREGLEGLGKVDPKSARASYPKPVTAFPALAKLALMACALTTNNNNVESRWSLLTYRYHAHVRHVTAEYMSAIFRQKDFETTNHLEYLGNENFGHIFAAAREFRRQNSHEYRNIYRPRQEEAEEREHRSSNPREKYAKLNTKETASTSTGSEKQRRTENGKRARRHVGDQMTQRDTSDSDSDHHPNPMLPVAPPTPSRLLTVLWKGCPRLMQPDRVMNRIVAMITMKGTMGLERNQRGRAKQSHLQWTILQVVTHIKTKMLCPG
jgi:hypothetical protein